MNLWFCREYNIVLLEKQSIKITDRLSYFCSYSVGLNNTMWGFFMKNFVGNLLQLFTSGGSRID